MKMLMSDKYIKFKTYQFQLSFPIIQGNAILLLIITLGSIYFVLRRKNDQKGTIQEGNDDDNNVSSRCIFSAQNEQLPYMKSMKKALKNPCHPTNNRKGHIVLCRAENKLIKRGLSKHLAGMSVAKTAFGGESAYCYDDVRGLHCARESIAHFIMKYFINNWSYRDKSSSIDTTVKSQLIVKPEHIVIGSGATSILSYLFFFLAEERDVVLIPAPYYAAFDSDTKMIARCLTYPVYMADVNKGPQPDELEMVYQQLSRQGLNIKILLLTNPNNPLGTVYSSTVIQNCVDWARSKKMHTIVDEIYAMSGHSIKNNNSFQSVTRVLKNNLEDNVHFVWALSKDFGCSGFRFGALYTQNTTILSAFGNINLFSSVSHPMQAIATELLLDDRFIDDFLCSSRSLLRFSYDIITKGLDDMKIPYVSAEAGIFVYCDFSSLLRVNTFEGEDELAGLFENHARIVMTPGRCQRDSKPGFFRICFAFVTPEVLKIGISRLHKICSLIRENGWDNINIQINEKFLLNC